MLVFIHKMDVKMRSKQYQKNRVFLDFQLLRNRKAQMEIMGLLVIIILLSVGMLFTVNYMIHKKPSEVKKTYTESQMASNILSAILKTSTPQSKIDPLYCHNVDFTELLQDCAQFESIQCYNGQRSCTYAEENIRDMLNKTLARYNKPYRFKAWRVNGRLLFDPPIINLDCDDDFIGPDADQYIQRQTKLSPVPLNPGTLMVQFDICS